VLHNQGRKTGDHQQDGETAKPVPAMMVVMAAVRVVVVHAVVMTAAMAVCRAAIFAAFIEREFVAHTNIEFAHKSPCNGAAFNDRKENIITKSSKVNHMIVSQFEFLANLLGFRIWGNPPRLGYYGLAIAGVRMPKGPQGQKRKADVIGNAVLIARIATGEVEDNHGRP
jgi:hypothetical protein